MVCATGAIVPTVDVPRLYVALRDCCPANANRSNIWVAHNACESLCFTHEPAVVTGWKECIAKQSQQFLNDMKAAGKPLNGSSFNASRCEYVDYATLRKYTKLSEAVRASIGFGKWAVLSGAALVLVVVHGL